MKNALKLLVAVAVPMALISAGTAEAKRWRGGKDVRLLKKLVKTGALEKADLDPVKQAAKDLKACRKEAKKTKGTAKGACLDKRLAFVNAKIAALEKAGPKVTKERWKKRLNRRLERLKKRVGKIQAKMSGGAAETK
jgi:hypothetical protein